VIWADSLLQVSELLSPAEDDAWEAEEDPSWNRVEGLALRGLLSLTLQNSFPWVALDSPTGSASTFSPAETTLARRLSQRCRWLRTVRARVALGAAELFEGAHPATIQAVLEPLLSAAEAGLWLFWPLRARTIALGRPEASVDGSGRLHRLDGPALRWSGGRGQHFWRDIEIPDSVVAAWPTMTASAILAYPNVEVRRVLIEQAGLERLAAGLDLHPTQEDACGKLFKVAMLEEPGERGVLAFVEVLNSTPEPDGTRKRYHLRVPPDVRTAREGVAWTFGLREAEYLPWQET
jgi:hypothetical protein